jgi:hypothetical protein
MKNLKRFTVCKLAGHKWLENHNAGTVARGAGGGSGF